MSKVAIVRCESYNNDEVFNAIEKGIELLGGLSLFARPGEKILLKPNIVTADPPEKCSTTHFSVVGAAAGIFRKAGAIVTYGDSPGLGSPEAAARISGITEAAENAGAVLADFRNGTEASYKDGLRNKKFIIADGVLESNGIISIPKLKTHGLARMTGCIKNQFGCIPGTLKAEFHARLPDVFEFAQMLVDLNNMLKPRLYIMDGVYAMEGNGPRSGTPRKMNLLMFSKDPVALDSTVCRLIGLEPEYVPTVTAGAKSGMGTYVQDEIELVGDPLESFRVSDFNVRRDAEIASKTHLLFNIARIFRTALIPKPDIEENKCITCGICVNTCPVTPKAVNWRGNTRTEPPSYFYKECIRCYCCQELCPEGAIILKETYLRRILKKIFRI